VVASAVGVLIIETEARYYQRVSMTAKWRLSAAVGKPLIDQTPCFKDRRAVSSKKLHGSSALALLD
jgi:uncharacterized lipoprotein YmbA